MIPSVAHPRNFSPIRWDMPLKTDKLKVFCAKNLKNISTLQKMLTRWENYAIWHKKTVDPTLKTNLETSENLCSLIHVSIEITLAKLQNIKTYDKNNIRPALQAAFCVEDPHLLVSRDERKKIQAVALHDKKTNELLYLITNPKNLVHRGTSKACKGAGSSIIKHLARNTLKHHLPLTVHSSSSAKEFYLKHNFEITRAPYYPDGPFTLSSSLLVRMVLTAEKISKNLFKI